MMHSWWSSILPSFAQDNTESSKNSTSFRLSKASSNHSSDPQLNINNERKLPKRKFRKRNKKPTNAKANPQVTYGVCDVIPPISSKRDVAASPDKQEQKDHCRVINLRIPLPMQSDTLSLHRLKRTEQISKLISLQGTEPPRNTQRSGSQEEEIHTIQPTLKCIELVNLTEKQSLCMQHQRALGKSTCVTTPSLPSRSILVNLADRPGSATTWKDIQSPPSPLPLHTPLRKPHPSTEYPDLMLASKQLSARPPSAQLTACRSMHNQIHVLRPLFRYSHRSSNSQCSTRPQSTLTRYSQCVSEDAHALQLASLTQECDRSSRNNLAHKYLPGPGKELPPRETNISLQAHGQHIFRYPHQSPCNHPHQSPCNQKRLPHCYTPGSKVTPVSKSATEEYSYPDPLVGGLHSYHRRLTQMGALVTETIRSEKENVKSLKMKKKGGTSTPRSSDSGSLGSILN